MINCEACNAPVSSAIINSKRFDPCTFCGALIRTDVFPAAFRDAEPVERAQPLVIEDDAGCYYHPSKKAAISCSSCGRFLCTLCDIDMDGRHICFPCMALHHKKQELVIHETNRFLYDSLALRLSILPIITVLFFWISFITAPIAFFIAVKHWKTKKSITPRGKRWRSVLALLFSSAQILGWIGFIVYSIKT